MVQADIGPLGSGEYSERTYNSFKLVPMTGIDVPLVPPGGFLGSLEKIASVALLTHKLADLLGVPLDAISLTYNGRDLEGGKTFSENGVHEPGPSARRLGSRVEVRFHLETTVLQELRVRQIEARPPEPFSVFLHASEVAGMPDMRRVDCVDMSGNEVSSLEVRLNSCVGELHSGLLAELRGDGTCAVRQGLRLLLPDGRLLTEEDADLRTLSDALDGGGPAIAPNFDALGCLDLQALAPPPLVRVQSMEATASSLVLRCMERPFEGADERPLVKLIVFDLDETLTLATFMPQGRVFEGADLALLKTYNFETPWVSGDRVQRLLAMFRELSTGIGYALEDEDVFATEPKALAVLTRNEAGVKPVLQLLQSVGLDMEFSAIWVLPWDCGKRNGAYREGGAWHFFDPPLEEVQDHKADILHHLCTRPEAFFPQMQSGGGVVGLANLTGIRPEQIMLVDDQGSNFRSDSGQKILRFGKVARYDAQYRDAGMIFNMGGLGAHDEADYTHLLKFASRPWEYPEGREVRCWEQSFEGCGDHTRVELVVFDFDETLTLATFASDSPGFHTDICWKDDAADHPGAWSQAELVRYNFESPFVATESRVQALKQMFSNLTSSADGSTRTLVVLAQQIESSDGPKGAVGPLNLLRMAGLDQYFTAIWSLPWLADRPNGVYRDACEWRTFDPPVDRVACHKAEVLRHVREHPSLWFPQLPRLPEHRGLSAMRPESIVLVDDERASFQSPVGARSRVLRVCKVPRYDESYRTCGLLAQMGGIGAHADSDYDVLCDFVERPWDFPQERRKAGQHLQKEVIDDVASSAFVHITREQVDDRGMQSHLPRPRTSSGGQASANPAQYLAS